ncbi:hypothetical protein M747DRAFT_157302 [Aspergillus niger ATCC 13496]|uniref:Uncharacterized protein n=1 Tax=Aspergillus niger ATCC 13496 TaxID=1353008 RepID=A0A370BH30_ASPNG|nr:hypothetical protein M747DRAFT_157302 [Aspergillus niger ATCC 13496]
MVGMELPTLTIIINLPTVPCLILLPLLFASPKNIIHSSNHFSTVPPSHSSSSYLASPSSSFHFFHHISTTHLTFPFLCPRFCETPHCYRPSHSYQ